MIAVSWCAPPHPGHAPKTYPGETYTSVAEIMREVCQAYRITKMDLVSARRSRHVAWPRQEAMYRAFKETGLSLPSIGRMFGNRDHTTVLHAIKRVEERLLNGPKAVLSLQSQSPEEGRV